MSFEAVSWALHKAPMLATEKGRPDTTARLVLVALAEVARGASPRAWPALATLEFLTGFNRESLRRALSRLAKGELIEDTGDRRGGCVVWLLRVDQARPESDRVAIEERSARRRVVDAERKRRSRSATPSGGLSATQDSGQAPASATQDSGQPPLSTTQSSAVHDAESPRTSKEPVSTEPVPAPAVRTSDERRLDTDSKASGRPGTSKPPKRATTKPDIEADFAEWWAAYPRKKDKPKGKAAYRRAVAGYKRDGETFPPTSPAVLLAAVKRLSADRASEEKRFTPYPASWLNGRRWEDEDDTTAAAPAPTTTRETARAWLLGEYELARVRHIYERTGIEYLMPAPPEDITPTEAPLWHRDQRRAWIKANAEMLIDRLTTPRMAAST